MRAIATARRGIAPVMLAWLVGVTGLTAGELRGHGGPVRAIAAPGPGVLVTGGFDQRLVIWDLATGTAKHVLRFHDGAVTALLALPDGCFASGGEDGRVALW